MLVVVMRGWSDAFFPIYFDVPSNPRIDGIKCPDGLTEINGSPCLAKRSWRCWMLLRACIPLGMWGVVRLVALSLAYVRACELWLSCFCELAPCLCIERFACNSLQHHQWLWCLFLVPVLPTKCSVFEWLLRITPSMLSLLTGAGGFQSDSRVPQ